MRCQRCDSDRILYAFSHGRDCQTVEIRGTEHDGYMPQDLGIGGGDEMAIKVCLDCGQLQGKWPLPKASLELDDAESWKCKCGKKNQVTAKICVDCDDEREDVEVVVYTWVCKNVGCKTSNDIDDGNNCWKCGRAK